MDFPDIFLLSCLTESLFQILISKRVVESTQLSLYLKGN